MSPEPPTREDPTAGAPAAARPARPARRGALARLRGRWRRRRRGGAHRLPAAPRGPREPVPLTRLDRVILTVLGLLAALTRLTGLTRPTDHGTPVFDEKHYVPQAWQMLRSTRATPAGIAGGGIEDNPGFGLVVHPPVAKRVLAIGEWLLGYGPAGWRVMSALAGVAVVLLLVDAARRLTGSRVAMVAAGVLGICDGVLFVGSRVGMLDMIQTLFILAAAWALLVDRDRQARRLADWARARDAAAAAGPAGAAAAADAAFGPRLPWRWWRFAAGVALGLALGVKWSGLYYMAAFGLWSVFTDLADRRRAGAAHPVLGALRRDTLPALGHLVAVPLGTYLLSWRSWFAQETSVYRHLPADQAEPGFAAAAGWPEPIRNFLHYQRGVLEFHASLTTSGGHHHPWESKPWQWLWAGRPMLYYSSEGDCAEGMRCTARQMLFGTPPIWWLLTPVLAWAAWRMIRRLDRRLALPVTGAVASWLPWAVAHDRQMYFFYATALIPFGILAFAAAAADLAGWRVRGRRVGLALVALHLALVVAAFAFWYPILAGLALPEASGALRFWLPSWR